MFSVISRTLVRGWVLPLCRGAVSVFYSPSRLGKLVGGGLTPLQRSSQCILQPQPTGQRLYCVVLILHAHVDIYVLCGYTTLYSCMFCIKSTISELLMWQNKLVLKNNEKLINTNILFYLHFVWSFLPNMPDLQAVKSSFFIKTTE